MSLVAVVDQGSTATKGALIAADGAEVASVTQPVARRVAGARVEHAPGALVEGVRQVLDRLRARERGIGAIGLACQRSTCLVWERASGRPLTPALSWQDASQTERLRALDGDAGEVARRTGLRLSPHYAAPKLAYLLERLPAGRERAAAGDLVAGTLDAFLLASLTGTATNETGHAGRTLLYNLEEERWDPWLCDRFGVPPAALPEIVPSAAPRGEYLDLPVLAVAGDQQAALLGHGGWRAGVTAVHFGTGAFVLAATGERILRHPAALSAALASRGGSRRYQIEATVNSAGSAVDWAARLTGVDLAAWGDRPLDAASLPLVLPALTGAAAPWWRPEARGVVAGLGLDVGREELFAGVVAGVVMRVVDGVETLAASGASIDVLRASGRLTRLGGLVRLLADAAGRPVEIAAGEEAGLAGLARLTRAALEDSDGPLELPASSGRELLAPGPPAAAAALRQRWLRFVERALEIG